MNDSTNLKRILIIDDDGDFRKLLLLRLGKMFAGVELEDYDPIARGVPEADFDWSRYDVLLLDYFLCIHGVTGLDILRKNRKDPRFPATIMLTGAGSEEIAVRALKSGVFDYIRKETLDKEELRKSILNAYEESKVERQRINEATLHGHAFNKELFYQQLEKPGEDAKKRILLVIQLDGHEKMAASGNIIIRDNVVRHIAKQSFEVFQNGDCNPNITRFSDVSVGLLIDDPESEKTLGFNLQGLCDHLKKRPYKFNDKKFRYTVSIGIVSIAISPNSVDAVSTMANVAVNSSAHKLGENSYVVYDESNTETTTSEPAVKPKQELKVETESTTMPGPNAVIEAKPSQPTQETEKPAETKPELSLEVSSEPKKPVKAKEESPQPETRLELEKSVEAETLPETEPLSEAKHEPPSKAAKEKPPELKAELSQENRAAAEIQVKSAETSPEQKPATEAPAKKAIKNSRPKAEKKAVKPRESDEAILNEATLNIEALEIRRSFEEKRVVQTFQPIISLIASEEENTAELYNISLNLIDTSGTTLSAEEIYSRVEDVPAFHKYIDRWMLREAIGRAVNSADNQYIFLMKISDASLADATLFKWLRDLLSGLETRNPGGAITLEISAASFSSRQKQAEALMIYLRKYYGFKFMLAKIDDVESIKALTATTNFDFLMVTPDLIKKLSGEVSANVEENGSLLTSLKNRGTEIVVRNIEDATTFTEVISIGADHVIGEFVGEASNRLGDTTNVESFEIS